jgi:N4-gp56 family major capsid protein
MIVTRSDILPEYAAIYQQKHLRTAQSRIVYLRYAQMSENTVGLPENGGSMAAKWRRWENISVDTTPLGSGITPEGADLTTTDITATALSYGRYARFTDIIKKNSIDNVVLNFSQRLSYNMQQTLDTITRTALEAGSNFLYSNAGGTKVSITSTDYINATLVAKAVRFLDGQDAMPYVQSMIMATDGVSTSPIPESYIGVCHTKTTYTLRTLTGFVPVEKYARAGEALPGEIGCLGQVRFIQTNQASIYAGTGASGIDVYGTLIFGTDAFGCVNVDSLSMNLIINELGSAGSSDPLHQRGSIGWKAAFAAKILNANFMIEIYHAVAA